MTEKIKGGADIRNTSAPITYSIAKDSRNAKKLIIKKIEKAEPIDERIPFVLPGLNLIAGRPKEGKSWLVLLSSLIYASNGMKVFYVSEDTDDIVIERLQLVKAEREKALQMYNQMLEKGQITNDEYLENIMYIAYDFEKALENLEIYTIDALEPNQSFADVLDDIHKHYDIVIIDTMSLILNLTAHENEYTKTMKFMIKMKQMKQKIRAKAVIITHHLRKDTEINPNSAVFDNVLGSIGTIGGADTVVVIERIPMSLHLNVYFETKRYAKKGKAQYSVLNAEGRIVKMQEYNILNELSDQQKQIVKAIIKITQMGISPTPKNIANALPDMSAGAIRMQLSRMSEDGILKKAGPKYYVNGL